MRNTKQITISILLSFSIALGVVAVLYFIFQLPWWFIKNGFTTKGICVNHFGEPYTCTFFEWFLRGIANPFILIPFVLPLFIGSWLASFLYLRTKPLRLATASTLLGCFILIPILGSVLSILALILGAVSLRKIVHNQNLVSDKGFALAGTILGTLGTMFSLGFLLIILLVSAIARMAV